MFNLVPVNNILQTAKIRLLMVGHTILKRRVAEPMIHKTTGIVVTHNLNRMQEQPTDLSLWKLLSTPKKRLRALVRVWSLWLWLIRIVRVVCEEGPFWGTPVVVTVVREVWGSQLKCLEKIPLQVQNKQVSNPLKLKGSLDTIYFLLRKGASWPFPWWWLAFHYAAFV